MSRITTIPIITNMIEDWNIFSFPFWNWFNKPSIHKTVDSVQNFIDSDFSIPIIERTSPSPATIFIINFNLFKDSVNRLWGDIVDNKKIIDVHNTSISNRINNVNVPGWDKEKIKELKNKEI